MTTRVTTRIVLLIATAAVAPLVIYGLMSVTTLRTGTKASVRDGNLRIADQAAEQLKLYVDNNIRILRSIGDELGEVQLEPWQQARILKNHVLDFPEFREISLFDAGGRPLATSRLTNVLTHVPAAGAVGSRAIYVAPLQLDNDSLPSTTIAVRLDQVSQGGGWLVAEISLENLWRMVDGIRVGNEGYALVVGEDGRLIAHGRADEKRRIATGDLSGTPEQAFAAEIRANPDARRDREYEDDRGRPLLAAAAGVKDLNWTVIVEQPTREAFGVAQRLERQLLVAISLALLVTLIASWFWGRSFLTRIFALTTATRAIAEGRLDQRVSLAGNDELQQLGEAFNSMANRLVQLQEDVRKQERQAMFGRIAAGLVHDLSHPIQNIGNSCRIIQKMFDDAEYRDTFKRTVERELVVIKRVLDDLRNIARPIPLERFPVEVNRAVSEVVESMQQHAEAAGLTLRAEVSDSPAFIEGDVFALGRVFRNLILNAIQATAPGGLVVVAAEQHDDRVRIRVDDTGCGIPADRLGAIFEDFVTTKRRGLGLGLAISRKIVEQLGGQITVASEVGRGTTFVLDFPRSQARPIALAVG